MRIVLADQNRTTLATVSAMLQAYDHEVHPFSDARQALDHARSDPQVDALIAGEDLTPMSGLELCWESRLIAGRPPLYVILMSSAHRGGSLLQALDNGADDVIGRPPVAEELYARLRAAERLERMRRELIRLTNTDPLTGLLNRRTFFEHAQHICSRVGPDNPLSAIMIDIDLLRQVNDRYGHYEGDEVLRATTEVVKALAPMAGRLGGEEFAVLREGETVAETFALALRMREQIAARRLHVCGDMIDVTCSFGVSQWREGDTIDRLLTRADIALHAAKTRGRNHVVAAEDLLAPTEEVSPRHGGVVRSRPRRLG